MSRALARGTVLVAAAAAALGLAACSNDSEHGILIEAECAATIGTLDVTVVDLEGARPPYRVEGRDVGDTGSDMGAVVPIRVAITLHQPELVLVHLTGHAGDARYTATRCYRVSGVLHDRVLLAGPVEAADDLDGDGFPGDADRYCLDPPTEAPVPCDYACSQTTASDCLDDPSAMRGGISAADINPAAEDHCENGVDENCDGSDAPCADQDDDGFTECHPGADTRLCDCDDERAAVHPGAEDPCGDGIDQDCRDGDSMCDRDGDMYPVGVDCDDNDPAINPGASETPGGVCDSIDNNCNGLVDEVESCTPADLDRDGYPACPLGAPGPTCDCNDCDPGVHPTAAETCRDVVDANCDLSPPTCPSGDSDHDGFAGTAAGGADCDDADPTVYPGAPDRCADSVAQDCIAPHSCGANADHDDYGTTDDCDDRDAMVHPGAEERCNGADDDCDGVPDEVLDPSGHRGCIFDPRRATGCTMGFCAIDMQTDLQHCGGCRLACDLTRADTCRDGACVCAGDATGGQCGEGTTLRTPTCCGDGCKDLLTDFDNCSGCGRRCDHASADACTDGRCTCGAGAACGAGQLCCNGTCTDPTRDASNCGVCNNPCGLMGRATVCVAGRCSCGGGGRPCAGGSVDQCCGGGDGASCTDLNVDVDNCGTCGTHVDITRDPDNCGACLHGCPRDQGNECADGACQCTGSGHPCGGGPGDRCCPAQGGCRNLTTDVNNCGDCGHVCSAHEHCDAGRCVCDANYQNCDPVPGCESDRRIDADNCARCGNPCRAPTPSCVDAACVACANAGDCPDDGLMCTGAPTCNAGTCLHPLLPGNCLISNICYQDGAIDTMNRCRSCQPAASPRDWSPLTGSPCDDGLFCTDGERCSLTASCGSGSPHACDDLVACTNDSCNESRDRCDNPIDMAACYIAAACFAGGTVNPANPCQQCVPATSRTAWTPRTGTMCDDGLYCTVGETCTSGAVCGGASAPARDCREMPTDIPCTADTCNETSNMCEHSTNAMRCLIGGTCYTDGTVNPAAFCQSCQSSVSQSAWSPRTLTPCDDGLFCTTSDACTASGMCTGSPTPCADTLSCTTDTCNETDNRCDHAVAAGSCAIGTSCYTTGQQNPSNVCEECRPPNQTSWSPRSGTCGNYCTQDTCTAGTCVAGSARDCREMPTDNVCTTDTCNESMDRCDHMNNSASCDDGIMCTDPDVCSGGSCSGPSTCGGGQHCDAGTGTCVCNSGRSDCDGTGGCECSTATCCGTGCGCTGGETCASGACCPTGRMVCGSTCCAAGETCAGSSCCGTRVCGGTNCCASATDTCAGSSCCPTPRVVCGGTCCATGDTCAGSSCCGTLVCGTNCCASATDTCAGTTCCPTGRVVCGTTCCPSGQTCQTNPDGGAMGCAPP